MKKLLLLTTLLLSLLFAVKAQTCEINTNVNGIGGTATAGSGVAQSFTACTTGRLNYVRVQATNTSSATAYVVIYSGETLSGTELGRSGSIAISQNRTNQFDLSGLNINVVSGQKYTARFFAASGSPAFQYGTYARADYYGGGRMLNYGAANNDMFFRAQIASVAAPTLSPAHQSTAVSKATNFTMTFATPMQAGTGSVQIKQGSTVVTSIPAADLTYDSLNVSFQIPNVLSDTATYDIVFGTGVLKSTSGISFVGIASGSWSFTTRSSVYSSLSFANAANRTNASPFTVTASFGAPVTGLELADFVIANGTVSNLQGSDSLYTVQVTPTAEGDVTLYIQNDGATAGSVTTEKSNELKVAYDTSAPTVALSGDMNQVSSKSVQTVTVSLSEKIDTLEASDFTLVNASIASITPVNETTYTVKVGGAGAGTVNISLAAGAVQDIAGNASLASNTLSFEYVPDLSEGLLAYYKFDNSFADESGVNNTLVVASGSGSYVNDRNGNAESAFEFGNIELNENTFSNASNGQEGFSVSLWAKPTQEFNSSSSTLMFYEHTSRSLLRYQTGQLRFDIYNGGGLQGFVYTVDTTLSASVWYHIVVNVVAGGETKIYINNQEVHSAAAPLSINTGTSSLGVGKGHFSGTYSYKLPAAMDEFRMYSRPLNNYEISELYNGAEQIYETRDVAICHDASYTVGNLTFDSTGVYNYFIDGGAAADTVVTLNLTKNAEPEIALSASSMMVCQGESIVLSASGGATYTTDGTFVLDSAFVPTTTATYTVTGTDSLGCSSSKSVTVVVNDPGIADQDIDISKTMICGAGDSAFVTVPSSVTGINYYLGRGNGDVQNLIAGPLIGNGDTLSFPTGALDSSASFYVYAEGQPDSATLVGLDFDGTNDRVEIEYNANTMNFGDAFTVETWINSRTSTYKRIFSNYAGAVPGAFIIDQASVTRNGRGIRVYMINSSSQAVQIRVDNVVNLNEWTHVAVTFNQGAVEILINGQVVQTGQFSETSMPNNVYDWVVGEDPITGASEFFDGQMDEFRVWNYARSQKQIITYKDRELSAGETGLITYLKMNDGAGSTTVTDYSGNNNHGTLVSMDPATDWVTGKVGKSCGVKMSEVVAVTVGDAEAPTMSVQDITLNLDVNGSATVAFADVNTGTTDNCADISELITSLSQTTFDCSNLGVQQIYAYATDPAGNRDSAMVNITVADTIAPTIVLAPANGGYMARLELDSTLTLTPAHFDGGSFDNCATPTLSLSRTAFGIDDMGEQTVVLTATDASNNSVSDTITFTVMTFNETPVVVGTVADLTIDEDAASTVLVSNVAALFSDPEGDSLFYSVESSDANITATLNDGDVSVVPAADFNGTAQITITARDSYTSASITATVTVTPVNDAPIFIYPQDIVVDEDFTTTEIATTTGSQPANEADQTIVYSMEPASVTFANVSLDPATGAVTVSAIANEFGTQQFVITADDQQSENNTATDTLIVTVNPVNDAPALSISADVVADEDFTSELVWNLALDHPTNEGQTITYTVSPDPASISFANVSFDESLMQLIVTSVPDSSGSQVFTITANDGDSVNNSSSVDATVVIAAVNDAPEFTLSETAVNLGQDFGTHTVTPILAAPADEANQTVTYSLSPATVSFATIAFDTTTGVVNITSIAGAFGTETFTITANDGQAANATYSSTFVLNVVENQPPVMSGTIADVTITEDATDVIIASGIAAMFSDPDGDALTFSVAAGQGITAEIVADALIITPDADYNGVTSVTLSANDGTLATDVVVIVTVTPVNDAPVVLQTPSLTFVEDGAAQVINLDSLVSDVDGDSLVFTINDLNNSSLVTVNFVGRELHVVPNANMNGATSLSIDATDGTESVNIQIPVSISAVNDVPEQVATFDVNLMEDEAAAVIDLDQFFTDADEESLVYSVANVSDSLAILDFDLTANVLTVGGAANAFGSAMITLSIADADTAITYDVAVLISAVNDAPEVIATPELVFIENDPAQTIDLATIFTDVEGDSLAFTVVANSTGVITHVLTGSLLEVTPVSDMIGQETLTITANDGEASVDYALPVTVKVLNNLPLVIDSVVVNLVEDDAPVSLDLSTVFSDEDGDELAYQIIVDEESSLLFFITIADDVLTIDPTENAHGAGTIAVTAFDADFSAGTTYEIPVTITSVNDAPEFSLDVTAFELQQDFTETATINIAFDTVAFEAGETITYEVTPNDGSLVDVAINEGVISITSVAGASGTETFTVTANDGGAENNTFSVDFTVTVEQALATAPEITLSIYPNPVVNALTVDSNQFENVVIYTLNGAKVITDKTNKAIDVTELSSGMYLIECSDENGNKQTVKIFKN